MKLKEQFWPCSDGKNIPKVNCTFLLFLSANCMDTGPGGSVGTAINCGLDGPGSKPSRNEISCPCRQAPGPG